MGIVRKKILLWTLLPIIVVTAFAFSNGDRHFEMAKNLDIFAALYTEVNTYYVDGVNPNTLMRTGVDAMLKKLDPYTVYIPEDDIENYRTSATGEYGGIGIQSNKFNKKHVILNLYENAPAFNIGMKIGDEIVAVDGISIINMSDAEAGKLMKGQSGTDITLDVVRNAKENLTFTTTREKIIIPNISYSTLLGDHTGYLRLSEFTRDAAKDVEETVVSLKEKGATQLIIDLRDNPGGLLNEAVGICNLFIPKDSKVVDTKGKLKSQSQAFIAKKDPLDLDIPIVILVNGGSASASEIVSGVIQDYDRGVIVGQKSYGKGLVQNFSKLSFNSQLKVTIAKYYTPSGRCIQALDYTHRNDDGSVGKIADSLKTEFRTTNNRIVYDGGGVDPDITTDATTYSSFVKNLVSSRLIFDYATEYYYLHEEIASPKSFSLSDGVYDDFVKWMSSKSFENPSDVESSLDLLKKAANDDKVYHDLVTELDDVSLAVENIKTNGLETFKPEIVKLLEQNIVLRYYYTSGRVEATLDKDEDIAAAVRILDDSEGYVKLLQGN